LFRARARGDEAEAGRGHQALLRARHRDVDAPGVHLERHAAERRDRIDHQQRVVAGRAHRLPDRLDVVDHPGRGVDLRDQQRLDLTLAVGLQPRLDRRGLDGAAKVAGQDLDLRPQHARGLAPADREAAAFQHQHLVAT